MAKLNAIYIIVLQALECNNCSLGLVLDRWRLFRGSAHSR